MNADAIDAGFAFIRPLWLLGLLVLPASGWAWKRLRGTSGWEGYIDPEKLRYLSIETPVDRSWMRPIVIGALALAILGLAGPSWRTIPLPVKQTRDAMVIAFDLSPSMLATDIKPDRLTRARLKIIDLLRLRTEGETALIAYADDAYRVSPLTDDARTIEELVPSLHPDVMPAPGSQVEAAVAMARKLLQGASISRGVLLIVTDGIDPSAMDAIEDELGDALSLCILAVGTDEGVPIPAPGGGFVRDSTNQIVLASLDRSGLRRFAARNGGCYADLRSDDADLSQIQAHLAPEVGDELEISESMFDVRHDEGFWFAFLLLPVAAFAFRKNILWMSALGFGLTSFCAAPGQALEWADFWQRADQRDAEEIAEGVASYRAGDYDAAAERFSGDSSLHDYDRGNAQALAGRLEEAIASYDEALEKDPDDANAAFNRSVVEELLEQQEQENQEQDQTQEQEEKQQESSDSSPEDSSEDSKKSKGSDESKDSKSQNSDGAEPDQSPQSDSQPTDEEQAAQNSESQEGEDADEPESAQQTADAQEAAPEQPEQEATEAQAAQAIDSEDAPLSDQSEQWLRNIPDDPGGLMRRKFQYQAETRRQRGTQNRSNDRY